MVRAHWCALPVVLALLLVCGVAFSSAATAGGGHARDAPVQSASASTVPVADFSVSAEANSSAALVGEAINFTCTQNPRIDGSAFEWEVDGDVVDDGSTHTQSFQEAGTYTVTCTVTDPTGETASGTVTVTVSDDSGDTTGAVSRVAFDYYDPSGSVVNLQVDGDREYNFTSFPDLDGTTVGGVSVNVTEHEPGRGHVELDGSLDTFAVGGPAIKIDNVEFGPRTDPLANVTFDSVTREQVDTNVGDSFTADGVDAHVINFTRESGTDYGRGGNALDRRSPQPPGGSAPSLLTYTNIQFDAAGIDGTGDGGTGTDGPGPTQLSVDISAEPSKPTTGDEVQFSADIQTDLCATVPDETAFEYEWDFDAENDGDEDDTGDGESPSYTYTSPGKKTVTLDVSEVVEGDEQPLNGSASTTVTVEPPNVSIDATPETGTPPQTISFSTDPVISGTSMEWRIDGTVVSTNGSFEHTFTSAGTHDVNLTVSIGGDEVSATETIRISQGSTSGYDQDGDGEIAIGELGTAAADYATGGLTIAELGEIAAAYARS